MVFLRNILLFSEAVIHRCSSKQVLWKILQYSQENICVRISLFQPHPKRDFNKEDSCEKCKIFMKSFFWGTPLVAAFVILIKLTVQWWASAYLLFLIKNKICGMVPTKNIDLLSVCCLHIISRNHSNTFLLINLQKTKFCPE